MSTNTNTAAVVATTKGPKFSDPYAEVKAFPVLSAGKEIAGKQSIMIKDDDGEWQNAGILSNGYNLVKNTLARDVADDIMSRSGFTWNNLKSVWTGKSFVSYHITNETHAVIRNGGEHQLRFGVMMYNSYDGSSRFGFEFFMCNMSCTNQYISRNRFGYFSIRHTDDNFDLEDAVRELGHGAQSALAIAPKIELLTKTQLTGAMIANAAAKCSLPTSKWGAVLQNLNETHPALDFLTTFDLYQSLTNIASHQMSGMSAIATGSAITDFMLDNFAK